MKMCTPNLYLSYKISYSASS